MAVEDRLRLWEESKVPSRFWSCDPTLWPSAPAEEVPDRLGWLELPERMQGEERDIGEFSRSIQRDGFARVVLLGMGGSSLAPGVIQSVYGVGDGFPSLSVLDSTHPAAVQSLWGSVDSRRTLFLVSSKSGTTLEPLSLLRFFTESLQRAGVDPGTHMAAISDPGTPLSVSAKAAGFRRVFSALPTVGGRYSALTHFGLVPAALIGVDLKALLRSAGKMRDACTPGVPIHENPGLFLGAVLGEAALSGRDKLTLYASGRWHAFSAWLEQLVAESTGKHGRGIIPVSEEPLWPVPFYSADRIFVGFEDRDAADPRLRSHLDALAHAGHPVLRFSLGEGSDLGAEFFRWEVAVAASGMILGIDPFDQPDVELAKELAREAMRSPKGCPLERPPGAIPVADPVALRRALLGWKGSAKVGDYVSIQAYLPPSEVLDGEISALGRIVGEVLRLPVSWGYGPRFLHSTGQLHKGGPNSGLFLQIVDVPREIVPVPGEKYGFGDIIQAQSLGDYQALRSRGRRVVRVVLGEGAKDLPKLREAIRG